LGITSLAYVEAIIATVHRPVGHFHIYFAGNATNCFGRELTSVQSKTHQCAFATNGGPFSYQAPECQGYIASDGNVVLDAHSTNEVSKSREMSLI
jgi:hypothetical protein